MNKEIMKALGFGAEIEAIENSFCPLCCIPIMQNEFRNTLSVKEYGISGICQKCQDDIFG